ncbi:MAG: hypothetical protein K0R29_1166 [Pseudobdellovibrio sp.]|nr:hypothetical protein [Pseudobdellovibrio sp.]
MRTGQKNKNTGRLSRRFKSEIPNEAIEDQTKKIPNLLFLGLGLASLVGQAAVQRYIKKRFLSPILGVWGPVFLIFGLYNKMVKIEEELLPSRRRRSLH